MTSYIHPSNPQVGKYFPTWIMKTFKKYLLDDIIDDPNIDPCKVTLKKELKTYQLFISKYLDYNSPFHDILIYHGLGTGKTATAIHLISTLYNYNPDWNIFVILPATLKETAWFKNMEEWLNNDTKEEIKSKIYFISSNSPTADKQFLEILKKVDNSKKSLYLIDEVHNFIHNVYTNLKSKKGKKALTIYNHIYNEKKEGSDVRVIGMSATPIKAEPFELSLLFNLLRPGCLPDEENKFNNIFLNQEGINVLNNEKKNLFQKRILGLVSYYIGSSAIGGLYAKQKNFFIDLKMSEYQDNIYSYYENIEKKLEMKAKGKSKIYKTYTRQSSNFVFPVGGEKRPRPSNFRVSEEEKIDSGKTEKIKKLEKMTKEEKEHFMKAISLYQESCSSFVKNAVEYFHTAYQQDKKDGYTINDDIKLFIDKYKGDFNTFHETEKKKSNLYNKLYECSAKMTSALFYLKKSVGKVLFYSNYVNMEGIQIFKIYLSFIGIMEYKGDTRSSYIEFHGGINMLQRKKNLIVFNSNNNIDGSQIKVILLSSAGAEGIDLFNIRTVLILEPNWDEETIQQIIGRAIRQCSHKDLPIEERNVEVYRFKINKKNNESATDKYIETLALEKQNLKDSFLETLKEAAVDCKLYAKHNMIDKKYNCFQFSQDDVLKKNPGPAYKKKFEDDENEKIIVKKIKVRKIKAITEPNEEPQEYLLDETTGIAYDIFLEFPVGKINKDDKGFFIKNSIDVYILSI